MFKFLSGLLLLSLLGGASSVSAAPVEPFTPTTMPVNIGTAGLVNDQTALEQLGKALFWDVNVGSDGIACASCHYHAGADVRVTNVVNRGNDGLFASLGAGKSFGPEKTLDDSYFPLHRLAVSANRNSAVTFSADDVIGSIGAYPAEFVSVTAGANGKPGVETCTLRDVTLPASRANAAIRQVTFRHTPSAINAAFSHRLFWDGSANNRFNALDTLGPRTLAVAPDAGIILKQNNALSLFRVNLINDALASQAMGPPANGVEMSCAGRTLRDVGRKLIGAYPLASQYANATDSLFSKTKGLVSAKGPGLTRTYLQLIKTAFKPDVWSASGRYKVNGDRSIVVDSTGYTQVEHNFPFIFGIAIRAYERTLISGTSAFDTKKLGPSAQHGLELFNGKAKCSSCHSGPLLTAAAQIQGKPFNPLDRVRINAGRIALIDRGFANTGVRPSAGDPGLGDTDPFLTPLSLSRQYVNTLKGLKVPDSFAANPCGFAVPFNVDLLKGKPCTTLPSTAQAASLEVAVDGAFKVPSLRNVALTPPYMHNGGFATLTQVVEFYNRGGNARNSSACGGKADSSGFNGKCSNMPVTLQPLRLSPSEMTDLVAFLRGLTDERVACHSAPFDHPSLPLTLRHGTKVLADGRAEEVQRLLPATGKWGMVGVGKPCFPNEGKLFGNTQTVFTKILNPLDKP